MRWPRFKKRDPEKPKKLEGQVVIEGKANGAYLVASTEQSQQASEVRIRGRLQAAKLIEASVNPATAAKVSVSTVTGAKYPDDLNDFPDYLDSYDYIPYVARAVDIKQFMIWQMGYDLECEDENSKKTVEQFLTDIEADMVIRDGTFAALLFGTMYWRARKDKGFSFEPLNPMKVSLKLDKQNKAIEYSYEPEFGKKETIRPEEMIPLKFRARPWDIFGVSSLRRVLPTVKALLFMEEKLPWIARRRADPLLLINIGTKEANVDDDTFKRVKNSMINRNAGEDIFNQNGVIEEIQEIYQSASVGGRQTVEPLLAHFTRNLVAGLGVPEPALGFGGTSTMATAEYQERILEAEVRDYQRAIKRMQEKLIFSLVKTSKHVKLVWRPMKEEDKETLSKLLQGEIEHAIVSPDWARQRLGYPEEAGKNVYIDGRLVHPDSKQSD